VQGPTGAAGSTGATGATGPAGTGGFIELSSGGQSVGGGNFIGVGGNHGAPEGQSQQIVGVAGHITAIYCQVNPATNATTTVVFQLRVNGGSPVGATCTIPVSSTTGSTSGLSVAINPGDLVDILAPASMPGGTNADFALVVGP
jgi:hypothetical protein